MKIKTANLTGPALDWAVAKCEGRVNDAMPTSSDHIKDFMFCPSTDWAQGGPIIEREGISLYKMGHQWLAGTGGGLGNVFGPTPLIAAMRCFVASRLGDEVDVPDELTGD